MAFYRRAPAWANRASPSPGPAFNANVGNARGPANGFPPLGGQANGKPIQNAWGSTEDKERLLANLAGSIVSILSLVPFNLHIHCNHAGGLLRLLSVVFG